MIRVVSVPLLYRVREGLALKRAPPQAVKNMHLVKGWQGKEFIVGGLNSLRARARSGHVRTE